MKYIVTYDADNTTTETYVFDTIQEAREFITTKRLTGALITEEVRYEK